MMNSSVVNTNSDHSVNITGINRQANRDRDAANMYIHEDRDHIDRDVSPDLHNSFACRSVRSASIDSIASMTQQSAQLPSCSSAMGSLEEPPTKKRRKQSNPVRYGQTALPTNVLPVGLDEEVVPEEDNDDEDDDDDDESLMAAGLQVSSQLQRSQSFSSSDDDSNDDDIEEDLERRKLLQQSVANVMNFHKYQHLCPHCNCPFGNDEDLRSHIEEEHVQKLLERQLFQHHQHHQQQLNNKSLLNGPNQLRASLSDLCKYDQNQHKFNSSDSPSGSSSSGSNNNSPLQSPSGLPERKSFDATLPLRHGSSDSNVKDFGSNFLPFQMPPNMPPLIPMSQSGGTAGPNTGDGSKASGQSSSPGAAPISLAMFSNPMAPFLFPIMPTGANQGSSSGGMSGMGAMGQSMSNGGQQVSSGGVRIFNPEAYCELCNKEFCNKYFLKTHKANKHGIYSMDTLVGPQGYGSPFFPAGLDSSSGSPTAAAAAALQMQHLLQSSAGMTPTSNALVVTTPVRSNVVNMESYCEICQKEFCNKYFLKKHKQKIHGIIDPNNPHHSHQSSSASPGSCSNEPQIKGHPSPSPPLVNTSMSLPVTSNTCMALVRVSTPMSTTSPQLGADRPDRPPQMPTPVMVSSQTSSPSNSFVCEICKHEFPNIISLQTHRFTTHYPQSMHAMIPNVSSAHLQSMASSGPDGSPAPRPIVGPVSSLSDTGSFVFTPEKLREMGVINADAFCEICCKEFCNKYFLRTHKINKHGMSFDSNSSSKSQSGRNSGDNKGDDSNNMSDDSFLEPGQRDPSSYGPNGSDFFNAMSGMHSELQCEHCSRPFASHYLLKMHKFYSHNIPYIKEEDIRKSMASSPGAQSEVPNDSIAKGISDSSDANNLQLVVRQHTVDSSGNGQTAQSSECESNGEAGQTGGNADQASQDLQKLQSMIKELNSSSYLDKALCHLCRQEFENKYFLRVHMMNDHGVIATEESAPMDSNTFMRNFFDANRQAFPFVQSSLQSGDSEAFCDICHKEFCSKYFLKTHKQNIHGIFEGPPTPTDTTPPPFPSQTPPHSFTSHRKSIDEAVNLAMSPNRSKSQMPAQQPMQLISNKQLSQMPSMTQMSGMTPQSLVSQTAQMMSSGDGKARNVTGRNYCNICNKELCNKYFMKTHMLKMHGINIDEHPVEASANSTIGGVTCDICQKELCSKYFLKVHKQNTHGIYEEPPQPKEPRSMDSSASNNSLALCANDREPQAAHGIDPNDTNNRYFSHYTEVCPLCERRFKSIKWLKTHMINDHSDIVALRPTDLSLTGPNADLSRMCILCGQTFSDRVALHIHLVKDHRTTAEELGISGNISGMKMTTNTATDLSLKSEQIAIGAQLAQHLSQQHQASAHQSRLNGSTSPSPVPTSMAMVSVLNSSHNSQRSVNVNNNNIMNNKFISIGPNSSSANTLSNSTVILTSTPTTAITNPLNSTNTNIDTNNAININTNNINNSNNCNKINANNTNGTNTNSNTNSGSNVNQLNTSVITCPTISSCLTSTSTMVINTSTSPTTSTAIVKEDRAPTTLLSSTLSSIISKRTGCGTRIYHCSYCNYSTRWLSNLYAHEKRHTRLNTEADKKFVCRVCHRAYRYNHSLQRHLLNHRSSGLNGRDVNAIALLASNSKGLLSSGLHSDKLVGLDSKFSRLFPGSSHTSLVGPTTRVKRYRCSKCNRKFRTRELCLAHIHVYHSDSRKIILSTASGKSNVVSNKVCRCAYCGFATRNYTLLKIHINKNHNKPTTSPANDLRQLAIKAPPESPLNLRKSTETATNDVLSLVRRKPESAASPSGSSDGDSVGTPQFQACGQLQLTGVGSEESPQLPMTYAMPQSPPNAGSFIMQPFLITQPDADGSLTNDTFVPSLVYLPVSHKVLQPVRVAFQLTPA